MKLGVEVKNKEESSNPKLIFLSDHLNPPTPFAQPPNPPQNTNFANYCPICMKFGVEVKNGEQSLNLEF